MAVSAMKFYFDTGRTSGDRYYLVGADGSLASYATTDFTETGTAVSPAKLSHITNDRISCGWKGAPGNVVAIYKKVGTFADDAATEAQWLAKYNQSYEVDATSNAVPAAVAEELLGMGFVLVGRVTSVDGVRDDKDVLPGVGTVTDSDGPRDERYYTYVIVSGVGVKTEASAAFTDGLSVSDGEDGGETDPPAPVTSHKGFDICAATFMFGWSYDNYTMMTATTVETPDVGALQAAAQNKLPAKGFKIAVPSGQTYLLVVNTGATKDADSLVEAITEVADVNSAIIVAADDIKPQQYRTGYTDDANHDEIMADYTNVMTGTYQVKYQA